MSILLGLSKTGYRNFCQQKMFVVHFVRKNPARSICSRRTPYQHKFEKLPSNALLCDECFKTSEGIARAAAVNA